MISAAIVEDELLATTRLKKMLSSNSEIRILWESDTVLDAQLQIKKQKPDLLFLDIHLPDDRGFKVLDDLDHPPYVIFTTAYDQYALEAFNTLAIDYLIKPYSRDQLYSAIEKYRYIQNQNLKKLQIEELGKLYQQAKPKSSISIKQGCTIKLIDFDDIAYISAEDKYCNIYLTNGSKLFCDYSLKEIEQRLNKHFSKVHRSHIINIGKVRELRKGFKKRYTLYFDQRLDPIKSSSSYANKVISTFGLE